MRRLRTVAVVLLSLLLLVGLPVFRTGYIQKKLSGTDAIASATVLIDQPSGAYVVCINPALHTDPEKLATWETFFGGDEIDFLFEDISCVVADSDAAGLELARSFQSRLPENQMRLRTEDITLMLSKAEHGRFDVMLLSREVYDAYGAGKNLDADKAIVLEEEGL